MSHEDAVRLICDCSGTQFDPLIVEVFKTLNTVRQEPHAAFASEDASQSIRNLGAALERPAVVPEDIAKESI
jgi:HD-GYP domain-containing protein (c-di-GMP phosphodiesterase class II)